jgi:hypothetical protein
MAIRTRDLSETHGGVVLDAEGKKRVAELQKLAAARTEQLQKEAAEALEVPYKQSGEPDFAHVGSEPVRPREEEADEVLGEHKGAAEDEDEGGDTNGLADAEESSDEEDAASTSGAASKPKAAHPKRKAAPKRRRR